MMMRDPKTDGIHQIPKTQASFTMTEPELPLKVEETDESGTASAWA